MVPSTVSSRSSEDVGTALEMVDSVLTEGGGISMFPSSASNTSRLEQFHNNQNGKTLVTTLNSAVSHVELLFYSNCVSCGISLSMKTDHDIFCASRIRRAVKRSTGHRSILGKFELKTSRALFKIFV